MHTLTVSSLNTQIKSLLETTFMQVSVEGELSRVTYHNSGHLYFGIKDQNSNLKCVMFRGNASRLKFRLEEGMAVVIHGAISVYMPRGEYQLNCVSIEPAGSGALALAYEQLKEKLSKKGYFEKKRPVKKFVERIAVITSATGAALQDMLRVANHRWPLVEIVLLDSIVQGERAAPSIANNIARANSLDVDAVVVGRGGGSIEDLWAFNEEIVAEAIYVSKIPVVSAVGHEIDYVISDFVADLRAPTPSAAMEMILADQNEMMIFLDRESDLFDRTLYAVLEKKESGLMHLEQSFHRYSIESKLNFYADEITLLLSRFDETLKLMMSKKERVQEMMGEEFTRSMANIINQKREQLYSLEQGFVASDPKKRVKKGFVQLTSQGGVKELKDIEVDESIDLIDSSYKIRARVTDKIRIV
jgi:exodeoxyribonuclease VII large subunit